MSRPSQTESAYVQTFPDEKCLCPDLPRRKVLMPRPSQTEKAYVQTVPDGKCLCPDYRAFKTLVRSSCVRSQIPSIRPSHNKSVYVQTIVRSSPDNRASCPDFRAVSSPRKNYIMWRSAIL